MNLEGQYFDWLYSHVGSLSNPNPARGYRLLAEQLHQKEFVWSVPNDDNRAADGVELRSHFLEENPLGKHDWFGRARDENSWMDEPCTMFELFIALSRRLAFETYLDGETNLAGDWFYQLLGNLDIVYYTDDVYLGNSESSYNINEALEAVINRTYSADGTGGLFPVARPDKDFRDVELWYQMAMYVQEYSGD